MSWGNARLFTRKVQSALCPMQEIKTAKLQQKLAARLIAELQHNLTTFHTELGGGVAKLRDELAKASKDRLLLLTCLGLVLAAANGNCSISANVLHLRPRHRYNM